LTLRHGPAWLSHRHRHDGESDDQSEPGHDGVQRNASTFQAVGLNRRNNGEMMKGQFLD